MKNEKRDENGRHRATKGRCRPPKPPPLSGAHLQWLGAPMYQDVPTPGLDTPPERVPV
jgi:hypothetical protein